MYFYIYSSHHFSPENAETAVLLYYRLLETKLGSQFSTPRIAFPDLASLA